MGDAGSISVTVLHNPSTAVDAEHAHAHAHCEHTAERSAEAAVCLVRVPYYWGSLQAMTGDYHLTYLQYFIQL